MNKHYTQLIAAVSAGLLSVALLQLYSKYAEVETPAQLKKSALKSVEQNLRNDLKKEFKFDAPKDNDGLFTKEFLIRLHTILYKYKKYGSEMLAEANFHERVGYLKEAEEIREAEPDESNELMKKYDALLKGEQKEID